MPLVLQDIPIRVLYQIFFIAGDGNRWEMTGKYELGEAVPSIEAA
jgi:hypothetical protein